RQILDRKKIRAGYLTCVGEHWTVHPAQVTRTPRGEEITFVWVSEQDLLARQSCPSLKAFDDPDYQPTFFPVTFSRTFFDRAKFRHMATDVSESRSGARAGTLVTSGNMTETGAEGGQSPRRNHCVVFAVDTHARPIPLDEQAVADYRASLTDFQKSPPFD